MQSFDRNKNRKTFSKLLEGKNQEKINSLNESQIVDKNKTEIN